MKHRNRRKSSILLAAIALALSQFVHAQVLWNFSGQYSLDPHNPPQSFAIGPNYTTGYALDVHGELLTPALGNVFKTDAPGNQNTYWRLFRGGKEYGNLFNLSTGNDFNINAVDGHLRFHTSNVQRMQINKAQMANFGHGLLA